MSETKTPVHALKEVRATLVERRRTYVGAGYVEQLLEFQVKIEGVDAAIADEERLAREEKATREAEAARNRPRPTF